MSLIMRDKYKSIFEYAPKYAPTRVMLHAQSLSDNWRINAVSQALATNSTAPGPQGLTCVQKTAVHRMAVVHLQQVNLFAVVPVAGARAQRATFRAAYQNPYSREEAGGCKVENRKNVLTLSSLCPHLCPQFPKPPQTQHSCGLQPVC